ncbi:MAG TPA: TIGR03013 family XrtA/PEP-CTERM system glycosyltransferase [Rhodanobacteraceae bacterium]|jgi:sugar transferase (PEP-CTERM system associated)
MLRFLRHQTRRWLMVLGVCEFTLLAFSFWIAAHIRFIRAEDVLDAMSSRLVPNSLAFAAMIVFGLAALGLYQLVLRDSWFGLLTRQVVGFVLGSILLVIFYFLVPQFRIGRGVLGIALLIGFVAVGSFRVLFMHTVDAEAMRRRILILGAGSRADLILKRMRRRVDRRGFTIVGFAHLGEADVKVPSEQLIEIDTPLDTWAERHQINEIVVGPDERRGGLPMEELLRCKQSGIEITELVTFFERESGKVKLSLAEPSWLVYSRGFDTTPLRRLTKRGFDLATASVLLLLTWPFMVLVALAIRVESGKGQPILYRQERVGERGRVFRLIKFRSMRTDAERDGVARWATKSDDRITRVGRVIRRLRLDELPQLWNVMRGDMSVIGPRPERPQFVAELAQTIRYYNLRHCVKPGLAGWAQLRYPYGASQEDAEEKLKYDLFYVKNNNLLFDILILIQTFEVVLFGRGAR